MVAEKLKGKLWKALVKVFHMDPNYIPYKILSENTTDIF